MYTPLKFNIAPEKCRLEDYFLWGRQLFRSYVSFRCVYCWDDLFILMLERQDKQQMQHIQQHNMYSIPSRS